MVGVSEGLKQRQGLLQCKLLHIISQQIGSKLVNGLHYKTWLSIGSYLVVVSREASLLQLFMSLLHYHKSKACCMCKRIYNMSLLQVLAQTRLGNDVHFRVQKKLLMPFATTCGQTPEPNQLCTTVRGWSFDGGIDRAYTRGLAGDEVAAVAGDTNICGGIVQLYWDNILGRCLDCDEQVRQSALKIVEIVLRQGLVHPITCIPYLIALETDPLESNSKLAHHLLMNMNEKYPAFFESRLGDGLQMSFMFMQAICVIPDENVNHKTPSKIPVSGKGKPESDSITQSRVGLSRIYKLARGNRMSRNEFMSSIVRKFDNPKWNKFVIALLTYCTEVLALLPFIAPDEPLYLIYAINRVVQVRAGQLEANFQAWCSSLLRSEGDVTPHGNGMHQQAPNEPIHSTQVMSTDLDGTFQQSVDVQPNLDDMKNRMRANRKGFWVNLG
ncbi:hypothetical protein KIW84_022816 [Lathyrus oleraceus]|uniref:Sister chromatid cohesion protein n=1 Tax=Pisum sativum TaxID=3888 RepID=A0A9D4YF95_PEA|nr:hypothetical protein KIW84_022816 [Pisum sativum]